MEKNILKSIENSKDEACKENSTQHITKKETITATTAETFSFSQSPSLEEMRKKLEVFCSERNWEQFHTPRNLLLGKKKIMELFIFVASKNGIKI